MLYILFLMFFSVGASLGSGNPGTATEIIGICCATIFMCFLVAALYAGAGFVTKVLELFNKMITFSHEIEKKKLEREED